ncbi:hypothetical protein [Mycoplasma crocodyli]|uniref:Uncharacterized protein n=1 Tax=Mycoplasma crocodyli (strain ATCC 51981 / MP145) TaxID=512564 RepID=D5E4Y7_MYCCM|nr:hypothetical protein [Mycoplasma crocodyli]ADE19800.1 hypothetical protein MCRO_0159 [Mycoplasma crocodyli MP145]
MFKLINILNKGLNALSIVNSTNANIFDDDKKIEKPLNKNNSYILDYDFEQEKIIF